MTGERAAPTRVIPVLSTGSAISGSEKRDAGAGFLSDICQRTNDRVVDEEQRTGPDIGADPRFVVSCHCSMDLAFRCSLVRTGGNHFRHSLIDFLPIPFHGDAG